MFLNNQFEGFMLPNNKIKASSTFTEAAAQSKHGQRQVRDISLNLFRNKDNVGLKEFKTHRVLPQPGLLPH